LQKFIWFYGSFQARTLEWFIFITEQSFGFKL